MLSAFISYSYRSRLSEAISQEVRAICEGLQIKPVDGKGVVAGAELSSQIRTRMTECNVVIVIAPSDVRSEYVSQEVGFAVGSSIPVILITDTNDQSGALISHQYKIVRNPNRRIDYAITLLRTLHNIVYSGSFLFPVGDETHEKESKEIFQDIISLDLFNHTRRKQNFRYDIVFGDRGFCEAIDPERGFYSVRFRIRFEAILYESDLYIECARTQSNFHNIYKKLVRQSESVYRYILKTGKSVPITPEVFVVERLSVNGTDLTVSLDTDEINSEEYLRYKGVIKESDRARLIGVPVAVEIEICTIADRERNEFTAIFGYPVKNLDTSFLSESGEITNIDVVDVISARTPAVKEPMGDSKRVGAKVSVRGWMLPDSAVIYVWDRKAA